MTVRLGSRPATAGATDDSCAVPCRQRGQPALPADLAM